SGLRSNYPETLRPSLEIIGRDERYNKVSGMYILTDKTKTYFVADTTVNVDPDPETIADIALMTSDFVTNFDITPQVALLSYSNFGSAGGASPKRMRDALQIIRKRNPKLIIDGEMQADTAVNPDLIKRRYPFSTLKDGANVLIFPNLSSGNIAYKLLSKIGGTKVIGPVLQGFARSVHALQRGAEVDEIVNMVALAVVDAQHKAKA
ncbi:MAG: NADP-dependent malic enzyme, partial [Chlorobi bacterium]|nr:NADP-dependent malic enzyme [Chlorobiota bacterium]